MRWWSAIATMSPWWVSAVPVAALRAPRLEPAGGEQHDGDARAGGRATRMPGWFSSSDGVGRERDVAGSEVGGPVGRRLVGRRPHRDVDRGLGVSRLVRARARPRPRRPGRAVGRRRVTSAKAAEPCASRRRVWCGLDGLARGRSRTARAGDVVAGADLATSARAANRVEQDLGRHPVDRIGDQELARAGAEHRVGVGRPARPRARGSARRVRRAASGGSSRAGRPRPGP